MTLFVAEGQDDHNLGRTKLVKELYFLQEHLGVDLRFDFVREAAGPLDPAFYRVQNLAQKGKRWINVGQEGQGLIPYKPGPSAAEGLAVAQRTLGDRLIEVRQMIQFFQAFDTLAMEQWATVHQVWSDLRRQGQPPTRQTITQEVLAWKARRRGFDEGSIARTIDGLADAGIIVLARE